MSWPGHLCPIVLLPLRNAANAATEHLIPRVKKPIRSQPSIDPRAEAARTKANYAYTRYHQDSSGNNRYECEQAKKELEEAYNTTAGEELSYKIRIIE